MLRIRCAARFPVRRILSSGTIPTANRLYFGKALLYSVVRGAVRPALRTERAAPACTSLLLGGGGGSCVRVPGRAVARRRSAATFATAFFGASVLPVYGVFLMPEIFNFTLVLRRVFPVAVQGSRADIAPGAPVDRLSPRPCCSASAPIRSRSDRAFSSRRSSLLAWQRRRWACGLTLGTVAVAVAARGCFAFNARVSGEFNYQGGDRKTFYGAFPFDDAGCRRGSARRIGHDRHLDRQQEVLTLQRIAGAIRSQRRVLPGRAALRLRAVLFSRRRRDRGLAALTLPGGIAGGC